MLSSRVKRTLYVHTIHKAIVLSVRDCGAIIHNLIVLTECVRLGSAELTPLLLHPSHASLASVFMLLIAHLHVVLRRASWFVIRKEGTITPFEDVHLGIGKVGIAMCIACSIASTYMFGPIDPLVARLFETMTQLTSKEPDKLNIRNGKSAASDRTASNRRGDPRVAPCHCS